MDRRWAPGPPKIIIRALEKEVDSIIVNTFWNRLSLINSNGLPICESSVHLNIAESNQRLLQESLILRRNEQLFQQNDQPVNKHCHSRTYLYNCIVNAITQIYRFKQADGGLASVLSGSSYETNQIVSDSDQPGTHFCSYSTLISISIRRPWITWWLSRITTHVTSEI